MTLSAIFQDRCSTISLIFPGKILWSCPTTSCDWPLIVWALRLWYVSLKCAFVLCYIFFILWIELSVVLAVLSLYIPSSIQKHLSTGCPDRTIFKKEETREEKKLKRYVWLAVHGASFRLFYAIEWPTQSKASSWVSYYAVAQIEVGCCLKGSHPEPLVNRLHCIHRLSRAAIQYSISYLFWSLLVWSPEVPGFTVESLTEMRDFYASSRVSKLKKRNCTLTC